MQKMHLLFLDKLQSHTQQPGIVDRETNKLGAVLSE